MRRPLVLIIERRCGHLVLLASFLSHPAFADAPPPLPAHPAVTIHAPKITGSMTQGELTGTAQDPVKLTYGGEFNVTALDVLFDRGAGHYRATGNPIVQELTAYMTAESIEFQEAVGDNLASGTARKALLVRSPYVIRADTITLGANTIVGDHAYFTTAPPNVSPAYSIRAEKMTLTPATRTADIKNGALYIFGTHVATLRHYKFQYASPGTASGHRQFNRPNVGVSSRYGVFGSFNAPSGTWLPIDVYFLVPQKNAPQLRLIATQSLNRHRKHTPQEHVYVVGDPGKTTAGPPSSTIDNTVDDGDDDGVAKASTTEVKPGTGREAANRNVLSVLRSYAIGNGILPDDDPLMFYQFVPWPITVKPLEPHSGGGIASTEQLSAHVTASGNEHNDLFVSRLPEVGLSELIPLTRVTARPKGADPARFRQYLRHPVLYAGLSGTFGRYFEQPTNIRHERWQYNAFVNTSAFLIGSNTVIVPRILATYNHYDGSRDGYRYAQGALSMMHYFTNRTALGVDYSLSAVSGNSPFNFDILDASQELDARAQVGNKNIAIGGVVRADVDNGRVFDYRITLAPTVRGVVPIFTYDYLDKSVNVDVKFSGIEF